MSTEAPDAERTRGPVDPRNSREEVEFFERLVRDFVPDDGARPPDRRSQPEPPEPPGRAAAEWLLMLLGAVLIALVLRAFVVQAFVIPSPSMEETLLVEDRVLVNKLSYVVGDISRGDIVVFTRAEEEPGEIRDLIKRVVGLEGDTVGASDNRLWVNGQPLEEPYLGNGATIADFGPVDVPEGHVFVMGDNNTDSYDSRYFGPVPVERVVGRAIVVFWPLDRIGGL